uniref:Ig-like domain-containing protein n=1 Tax=Romanomermis culicivorax TaxID=13658 RepID=A0A915IEZ8_ROMCU
VKEHQTARFEVKVAGEPQPTIRWTKDGRTLISDGEKLRTSSYDDGWSTLALSNVDYADRGIYTCTAANRVGEVQCSAELIVQSK